LKTIFKKLFLVSIILVTLFSCSKDEVQEPYSQIEKDILQLVNQHRASLSLGALNMNEIIFIECKQHSTDMAKTDSMNHIGFTDRASNIYSKFGGSSAAENVAYGYNSASEVVTAWLNSPGHRANIEGDYNYTGISVVKNSKGINYFTQIFIKK
jgi:uncharacterized protein YkwD